MGMFLLALLIIIIPDNGQSEVIRGEAIARPFTQVGQTVLEIQPKNSRGSRLIYTPNHKNYNGISGGASGIAVATGKQVEPTQDEITSKGATSFSDYQLHVVTGKVGFDFFLQKFHGFYREVPASEQTTSTGSNGLPLSVYPQLPDMSMEMAGLNIFYIFNNKDFSYEAAFDQTARQTKSGGSWMVMVSGNNTRIRNTGAIIPDNQREFYGDEGAFTGADIATAGVLMGGAYTFTSGRAFLTGALLIGPVYQQRQFLGLSSGDSTFRGLSARSNARGAIGFNGKTFMIGITGIVDQVRAVGNQMTLFPKSTMAQAFIGLRF